MNGESVMSFGSEAAPAARVSVVGWVKRRPCHQWFHSRAAQPFHGFENFRTALTYCRLERCALSLYSLCYPMQWLTFLTFAQFTHSSRDRFDQKGPKLQRTTVQGGVHITTRIVLPARIMAFSCIHKVAWESMNLQFTTILARVRSNKPHAAVLQGC